MEQKELECYAVSWLDGRIARSRRFFSGTPSEPEDIVRQKD
jgi:hypothetical protein